MSTVQKIIGGIAVIALILGLYASFKGSSAPAAPAQSGTPQQLGGISNTNALAAGATSPSGDVLPGPSVFDYLVARTYLYIDKGLGFGNATAVPVTMRAARAATVATSTVGCAVQNPFTATSSITHASIYFTTAPTSTLSVVVGTTTFAQGAFSTSSSMETISVPVSATTTAVAWDPGVNNDAIGPSQWVTWGIGSGSTGINFSGVGNCNAIFITNT